jgi:hypothetical protein
MSVFSTAITGFFHKPACSITYVLDREKLFSIPFTNRVYCFFTKKSF